MKECLKKDFLFISYFFPPLAGGGIPRALNLVRYALDEGWQANVITIRNHRHQSIDPSLLENIPLQIPVTRTPSLNPFLLYKIFGKLGFGTINKWIDWLLPIDNRIGWLPFLLPASRKILKEKPIQIILSTSSPYCSHMAAMKLKKETRLPWLADFRDPWTFHNLPFYSGRTGQGRRQRDETMERQVYEKCDGIIVNTHNYQELLTSYFKVPAHKIHLIPNGYSEQDFEHFPPLVGKTEQFILMYAGSAYDDYNPSIILDGFAKFYKANNAPKNVRLWLIGQVVNWFQDHRDNFDIPTEVLICEKQVAHLTVIQERYPLATAFFFGYGEGMRWTIPGKLYEYLRTQKPILAAVPNDSDVIAILEENNAGVAIGTEQTELAAATIQKWYDTWKTSDIPLITTNLNIAKQYERREIAKKFTQLFEQYSSKEGK